MRVGFCRYASVEVLALEHEAPNMGQVRICNDIDQAEDIAHRACVRDCAAKGSGKPSALGKATKRRSLRPREKLLVLSWREQLCTAAGILVALPSCPSACRQPCNVRIAVHGLGGHGHLYAWPLSYFQYSSSSPHLPWVFLPKPSFWTYLKVGLLSL